MNKPILRCQCLAKTYHDGAAKIEVLRNIELTVQTGEVIAIVGASGCGKSTLLHLLAGLDQPSQGHVYIQGQRLDTLNENAKCHLRNHYLGFVYQFHHLLPEFSALENVSLPLLIRGVLPKQIRERAIAILEQVGLGDRLQHRLSQLSGGERQRVAIARALVTQPACVLADEPTGNLDPRNAERVLQLFYDLQQQHKTSIIMVTHAPHIVEQADRKYTIEDGELVTM